MLVQKLRTGNLQSERGRYDGTLVYAQHKVREELEICSCVTHGIGLLGDIQDMENFIWESQS